MKHFFTCPVFHGNYKYHFGFEFLRLKWVLRWLSLVKPGLRFFSYFRDIKTNEYFSLIKICNIKNIHLMNQILPDKVLKGKRKEDINQRLIDMKLNKSEYILSFVKFYLFAYLFFTAGYIYYQAKNYNKRELP